MQLGLIASHSITQSISARVKPVLVQIYFSFTVQNANSFHIVQIMEFISLHMVQSNLFKSTLWSPMVSGFFLVSVWAGMGCCFPYSICRYLVFFTKQR